MDDIIIFSSNAREHAKHVDTVMALLQKYQLFVNAKKIQFMKTEVKFLGFRLSHNLISTDPEKTKAISEFPFPKSADSLKRFLGMTGFLANHIRHYATLTAPLSDMLAGYSASAKSRAIQFSVHQQEPFENLKQAIVKATALYIPDLRRQFLIVSDASGLGIGGALIQDGFIVAFVSSKLNPAQRKYSIQEKELYASIYCIKKWHSYIAGIKFLIISDHKSLATFRDHKWDTATDGRRARNTTSSSKSTGKVPTHY